MAPRSEPAATVVALEDRLWLKITSAEDNFVSTGVLIFRGVWDQQLLRERLIATFSQYPKLRSVPAPSAGSGLRWVPVPDFDVMDHVEEVTVDGRLYTANGCIELDRAAGAALLARVGEDLPRGRPLWKLAVLRGLSLGSESATIVLLSTHHSVADGVAYFDILTNLLQHSERGASHAYRGGADRLRVSERVIRASGRAGYLARLLVPEPSSLLTQLGPSGQRLAMSQNQPLQPLTALAKAQQLTVNALALAALAGALRDYLAAHSTGAPPTSVRAVLPVSMHRAEGAGAEHVNRMGYCMVRLDLQETDTLAAARAINAQLKTFRSLAIGAMMYGIAHLVAAAPARLSKLLHRFFSSRASLVVSCFPFPTTPLRLGAAEVCSTGAFPVIAPPMRLSAMIETHGGSLCFYLRANQSALDVRQLTTLAAIHLSALCATAAESMAHGRPWTALPRPPDGLLAEEP